MMVFAQFSRGNKDPVLIFLRISGFLLFIGGALFAFANCGITFMSYGNLTGVHLGFAAMGVGLLLLVTHAIEFARRFGLAASGITIPGMVVLGLGLAVTWWFLFGPWSYKYPSIYGIGTLVVTLFISSQILPRLYRLRRPDSSHS